MSEYNLLMPFCKENDDPLFVRGFECGEIEGIVKKGGYYEGQPVHVQNKKQIGMILDRYFYQYRFEEYDEEWCFLTAYPTQRQN